MEKSQFQLYKKNQIPMLVLVMGMLIVAVAWSYWLSPMYDAVRNTELEVEKTASTLAAKDKELNAMKEFKIFLTKESEKVDMLNKVLPAREELDDVLIQVEKMAVENKIYVNSISVEDADKPKEDELPGSDKVKVAMQLDGEYPNMLKFVESLQKSTRLFLIDNIGIVSNIESPDQSIIYTMEMNILFQK